MQLIYPFGNHVGKQFGHLLAVSAIETDPNTGDPVIYDCKCMKCGKEHIHVLDRDLITYKVRCCENCDRNDLTGMRFGRWTVIKRIENASVSPRNPWGRPCYECKCDCGKIGAVTSSCLISGKSKSCGCLSSELAAMRRFKDLTGQTFGRLTVIKRVENSNPTPTNPNGRYMYECKCDCGNPTPIMVSATHLRSGHTQSCGCLKREKLLAANIKWTEEENDILAHYNAMYQRCLNPNCKEYHNYGNRGITICKEWLDKKSGRKAFVEWSKSSGFKSVPKGRISIDRINNDGPYAPWNCRWVTAREQANNRRSNVFIEINGTSHTLADWARICKINYGYLQSHYKRYGSQNVINVIQKALRK